MTAGVLLVPDHGGDIAREIVQRQVLHRAVAVARPARLRPQYTKACFRDSRGELVEIEGVAAAPGQQNHRWAAAFGDDFDTHVIMRHDPARTLGLRRRDAQHRQREAGENQFAQFHR